VAPRLVLTAGHCVITEMGRLRFSANFRVTTGHSDYRLAAPGAFSTVSQVLMFPDYQPARYLNDAALLVLTAPVSVPSLSLAGPGDAGLYGAGTPLTVCGLGADATEGAWLGDAALRLDDDTDR